MVAWVPFFFDPVDAAVGCVGGRTEAPVFFPFLVDPCAFVVDLCGGFDTPRADEFPAGRCLDDDAGWTTPPRWWGAA